MWIGSIRLIVQTRDAAGAGANEPVRAVVLRDGAELRALTLDYPAEPDPRHGDIRRYDHAGPTRLPRRNDKTPELPSGTGQDPTPYPGYGLEYSDGLRGHLAIRLEADAGGDLWVKDNVDLYVRLIRRRATGSDTLAWVEDADWTYVASWSRDAGMSIDSGGCSAAWTLRLS